MGRTVLIGDVHGCADELEELLGTVGVTKEDRVVCVGDLVARGPDSRKVLRLVRQLGILSVRGNHEQKVIVARQTMLRGETMRLGPAHQKLLDELSEEDWAQLEALPLSIELADHDVRVVHAGVAPGVAFEEQQAWTLLHIRSLTAHGAPSDRFSSTSWAEEYDEKPHVVFGHNAQAGLQLCKAATGLDTGCVYGGRLTALVLAAGQTVPKVKERKELIVSVEARARYVEYGPRPERLTP